MRQTSGERKWLGGESQTGFNPNPRRYTKTFFTASGHFFFFSRYQSVFLFFLSPSHLSIFNNYIDPQPTILTHRSSSLHGRTRHVCILTAIMYIFSVLNQNSFPTRSVSQVFPTSSFSYCPFFAPQPFAYFRRPPVAESFGVILRGNSQWVGCILGCWKTETSRLHPAPPEWRKRD